MIRKFLEMAKELLGELKALGSQEVSREKIREASNDGQQQKTLKNEMKAFHGAQEVEAVKDLKESPLPQK